MLSKFPTILNSLNLWQLFVFINVELKIYSVNFPIILFSIASSVFTGLSNASSSGISPMVLL